LFSLDVRLIGRRPFLFEVRHVRIDAYVSPAESVFQRRVGKNGMFSGTAALLYPAPFGELIYFANLNEGSYRLGLGHNCGDRYRRCMELSKRRVQTRRPTWACQCCKAVTNIERATYAREKTKERKFERGNLRISMHGHSGGSLRAQRLGSPYTESIVIYISTHPRSSLPCIIDIYY